MLKLLIMLCAAACGCDCEKVNDSSVKHELKTQSNELYSAPRDKKTTYERLVAHKVEFTNDPKKFPKEWEFVMKYYNEENGRGKTELITEKIF